MSFFLFKKKRKPFSWLLVAEVSFHPSVKTEVKGRAKKNLGEVSGRCTVYNQNMLDTLTLVSFLIGMANYEENLTQSDKDDIMNRLDHQTKNILLKVQESLEEQNIMLREILSRLEE